MIGQNIPARTMFGRKTAMSMSTASISSWQIDETKKPNNSKQIWEVELTLECDSFLLKSCYIPIESPDRPTRNINESRRNTEPLTSIPNTYLMTRYESDVWMTRTDPSERRKAKSTSYVFTPATWARSNVPSFLSQIMEIPLELSVMKNTILQ
jgi:hypothetical protein